MPLTLGNIAKSSAAAASGLTIVNTGTYGSTADASTHSINLPASVVSGDLLAVFVTTNGATLTAPSGWSTFASSTTSSNTRVSASYRISDGTEGSSLSITASASTPLCAITYRIVNNRSSITANTDLTTLAGSFSSTTTPNPGTAVSPWGSAENLWIVPLAYNSNTTTVSSYISTYDQGQTTVAANRLFSMTSCAIKKTASFENPGAYTLSSAQSGTYLISVIRPV